jgi:hypothetical protein
MEGKNYITAHTFCTKDPKKNLNAAIRSCSISTELKHHNAVNRSITGDGATWDATAGASRAGVEGPPQWQTCLEVEERHRLPVGKNRCRQTRREWSPFDHKRRRRAQRSRESTPGRSFQTPKLQNQTPTSSSPGINPLQHTMTR